MSLVSVYRFPEADRILFELLRQRSIEDDPYVNISHRKLPTWSAHKEFVKSRPYRCWYLILEEDKPVGATYISKQNEIGIALFKEYRGKGYGLEALNQLTQKHKPLREVLGIRSGRFLANINPKNERSIRLFQKIGFEHLSNTYAL